MRVKYNIQQQQHQQKTEATTWPTWWTTTWKATLVKPIHQNKKLPIFSFLVLGNQKQAKHLISTKVHLYKHTYSRKLLVLGNNTKTIKLPAHTLNPHHFGTTTTTSNKMFSKIDTKLMNEITNDQRNRISSLMMTIDDYFASGQP